LGNGLASLFCTSPVSVIGGFADWCQVSAGRDHSLAVRTNGTLWAWGSNYRGQLGDGTTVAKSSPISVIGGFTDWCQVSAGSLYALRSGAIRQNGTLWTWGTNYNGALGVGDTSNRSSPTPVVGGFTDWRQVSVGNRHFAAIRSVLIAKGF
jgi:alpha-tubulin suppressor-like RCC1 family protein